MFLYQFARLLNRIHHRDEDRDIRTAVGETAIVTHPRSHSNIRMGQTGNESKSVLIQ